MKNSPLVKTLVVPVFVFLLFLVNPASIFDVETAAQVTCHGPLLFDETTYIGALDPYWPKGTSVKVYFEAGKFTVTQRNDMKGAFEAWDSHRINNRPLAKVGFVEDADR